MKKTLFLSLALASCGLSATETRLLNGVTTTSGYYDVSKYLVRDPDGGIIDSQTCAAVAASNMLAYWYSQNTKEDVDANLIYDRIFDYTKNASTTIAADCNFYASAYNHASAEAVCTTSTYVPTNLAYKVDVTPAGYDLKGSLYTSMSVQEAITWGLQNNLAMGLTMNQTPGKGAHALTIWGGTFESYGAGDPERLTGIYYTNSDNGVEMNYATFSSAPNADGETEYFFNDGTNRRWKMVEITFLLDPYAKAPENPDNNPVYLGKGGTTGDYTIGGTHANATSFNLNANATLIIGAGMELASSRLKSQDPKAGLYAELSGKGTYIAENLDMGYAKLGKDWSGTVRLTGTADTLSVGTINNAAVGTSKAELQAVSIGEWKEDVATVKSNVLLTNDSVGSAGLSITDANGTKNISFAGAVSGSGDLRLADQKGGATHTYTFQGDVKDWTGSLRSMLSEGSELNIYFKENKEVNANVENVGAGKVSVSFEKGAVINGNLLKLDKGTLTVTAEDATTFNGAIMADTLVLNGQVTINDPATKGDAKSLPSGDSGITNTEHFNVKTLSFNNGATLTLNGDFDLSGVNIFLAQDYIDSILAGGQSTMPLIYAAQGSTLSGTAKLANTVEGYSLERDSDGNLGLRSTEATTSLALSLDDVLLSGNVLKLLPEAQLPDGVDLGSLEHIDVTLNGKLIRDLVRAGADPNMEVSISIGDAKDLTNVWFYADGATQGYNGNGLGAYRLGSIPEPATATLSLLALAALSIRRKRS